MPGEWSSHAATWIAWPHERSDWPGHFEKIPPVYVEIVRALAAGERVEIVVESDHAADRVRARIEEADVPLDRVGFHPWPTDRSWVRDSGPTCVATRTPADGRRGVGWVRWRFNAWAKYENWHRDSAIGDRIAEAVGGPSWAPRIGSRRVVLEGGAIDANGEGTLLTTEECLLSTVQARNPGMSREALEALFSQYLGIDRVVWLPRGIVGDDTHGHVDDAARFLGPKTLAYAMAPDHRDANHAPLAANHDRLLRFAEGPLAGTKLVELPMPRPISLGTERLPASYANFYIANTAVLVPQFDDPADATALEVLRRELPGRTAVGIPCRDLVVGLGTLHCLTQPEFAEPAARGPADGQNRPRSDASRDR